MLRESDLLEYVCACHVDLGDGVPLGPGDDMAVVRTSGGDVLIGVDQTVGGRHVNEAVASPEAVGRKAVARSLSDVAAMAARPVAALAAATFPPDYAPDRARRLFDGMTTIAREFRCPLVGGDVALHANPGAPVTCTVTVLGVPGPTAPVRRSGARPGNGVYVTGRLGGSLGPDGLGRHLTFSPRIHEALDLAGQLDDRLHAMIDVSDGLGRDAAHIARQSSVRIRLESDRIPRSGDVDWRRAISDGEDYELFFAADGDVPSHLGSLEVSWVGEVTESVRGAPPVVVVEAGREIAVDQMGWQHESC